MTAQRVHCTNHCSACGTCFHSIAAFDAHREGSYSSNDSETRRRCVHPLDKRGKDERTPFIALTTVGVCNAYSDAVKHDVTIWTLRERLEAARAMRWPRPAKRLAETENA